MRGRVTSSRHSVLCMHIGGCHSLSKLCINELAGYYRDERRFSSAGLSLSDHVPPIGDGDNRSLLDSRWLLESCETMAAMVHKARNQDLASSILTIRIQSSQQVFFQMHLIEAIHRFYLC